MLFLKRIECCDPIRPQIEYRSFAFPLAVLRLLRSVGSPSTRLITDSRTAANYT